MGTVYGSPSYTSSASHTWKAYCTYPDSGTGTATVGIQVTLPGSTTGHLFIDTVAYIDGTEVGTFKNNYYDVPTTKAIGTKSVGPGSHSFKVTFRNSGYNINGDSSGSFTVATPVYAPSYNSISASSIGTNSVVLSASINNGGASITAGGWQLSTNGGTSWTTYSGDWGSKTITGLNRNTTYTYRGYATNSAGTTYSSTSTFTTLMDYPTVSAPTVSNLTYNSLTASFTITDNGGGTITSSYMNVYDRDADVLVATINGTSGTATGLSPSTVYVIESHATNARGASNIPYVSVTTPAAPVSNNVKVSINGANFVTGALKLSQNGGAFTTIPASKIKTSINGGSF